MFFERIVKCLGRCKSYSYAELFGAYCNTKLYKASIYENYTEIKFENEKYMIVRDYIKYLENRYDRTDFREPKERQVAPHYKSVEIDGKN